MVFWQDFEKEVHYIQELAELVGQDASSAELEKEITGTLQKLTATFEQKEIELLLSGEYDRGDAILSIHAGAGGVDAMDWADMLLRMYTRYAEEKGFSITVVTKIEGAEAGIKSAVLEISGTYAYGNLRTEAGVHRLVRLSPFNSDHLRQTSFALVEVLPVIAEKQFEIRKEDLRVDTFRASGAGGQHVNKTSSAVRFTHIPSGIVVACQSERSQHQNREAAMKILRAKLFERERLAHEQEKKRMKGEHVTAEFGNQIRSYVLQPYRLVKDHRTNYEESNVDAVLDGHIDTFIEHALRANIT